jgi:long-chain acyl-CoA synthetase
VSHTINNPDTLQTLIGELSAHGNRPALLTFHKHSVDTWSFADLLNDIRRLGSGLLQAGLAQGERVAIYSPNRPEWLIGCLAVLYAAAVPVPIDSQIAGDDLTHVIKDSDARWIMTTRSLADRLSTLGLNETRTLILLDAGEDDPQSWHRLRREPASPASAQPEDEALLFYTSGVSGRPKGVPLSHRNLLANLRGLVKAGVYRQNERLLLPLPLHHVYPFMIGLLAPLALGVPIILPHSLTGPQIIRALREGSVTAIVGVPRLYAALYDAIECRVSQKGRIVSALFHGLLTCSALLTRYANLRIGSYLFTSVRAQMAPQLRTLVYGGSALAADLAWRLAGLGWEIAGGYGLTETSPILTIVSPGSRRIATAGKPLPGVEIRIADRDQSTGHGEIQARGPNVFSGYLHLPDHSAEAFTSDGWFRSGDLGYLDRDGCLHLVGRASSRMTLPGGEKIWPERVEEVLDGAPSIRESGVLARHGRLVGVIVPPASVIHTGEREQLIQLIRADLETRLRPLPSYYRLTDFIVSLDPLPRTRLGKIQRHKLAALFEAGKLATDKKVEAKPIAIERMTQEDRQLLEDPVALHAWNWLAERFATVRLTPETNMSLELGVDSLEWMTMSLQLSDRVGIDLPEDAIARIGTVRDLLREAVEAEQTTGVTGEPAMQLVKPDALLDADQQQWLSAPGWFVSRLGAALLRLVRWLTPTLFSLEVHGVDRVPVQAPCVLAPNHASLLDAPALIAVLSDTFLNQTYWGGWTGIMFRNPVMRLVSRATRVLPIDQSSRPLANLALAAAAVARGHNLVWFPEGTRSPDGRLQPFQPGIGLVLTAHPVPVVPVRIDGTFEALPRSARWPRRGTIRITFGTALDPRELGANSTGAERYRRIAAALQTHVVRLGGG